MENEDILIISEHECDCGCGCGDVELYSPKEPDILLVDEYMEPYENDIIATREAAEKTLEATEEIVEKANLLLDDHQTIKRELRQGIIDILAAIAQEAGSIRDKVADKATEILNLISNKYTSLIAQLAQSFAYLETVVEAGFASTKELISAKADDIKEDIAELPTFIACTEEEIYAIFEEEPPHEKTFDDIPVVDGYMELEGFEDVAGLTPIYKDIPEDITFDDVPVDEDGYMSFEGFLAASGYSVVE